MMKKNEEQLLREYVESSLVLEFDQFSTGGGVALRKVFSKAAGKFGSAMAGATKKVAAAVGKTLDTTIEAFKEVGSFGLFRADYDGVEKKYQKKLQDIASKHGQAMASADEAFFNVFSPVKTALKAGLTGAAAAAFFMNPLAFIAASGVAKHGSKKAKEGLPKLKQKAENDIEEMRKGLKNLDPEIKERLKDAQRQVKNEMVSHFNEMNQLSDKILTANTLKELSFSDKDIQDFESVTKDKEKLLKYGKKLKLTALLQSLKKERDFLLQEVKKTFGSEVPENALVGKGSPYFAYSKIVDMVQQKIDKLK